MRKFNDYAQKKCTEKIELTGEDESIKVSMLIHARF